MQYKRDVVILIFNGKESFNVLWSFWVQAHFVRISKCLGLLVKGHVADGIRFFLV